MSSVGPLCSADHQLITSLSCVHIGISIYAPCTPPSSMSSYESRQSSRSRYEFADSPLGDDSPSRLASGEPVPSRLERPPGRNPLLEGVCRACVDITDVLTGRRKLKPTTLTGGGNDEPTSGDSQQRRTPRPECPLDQVSLGRKSWSVLHTLAAYYPDRPSARQAADMDALLRAFSRLFPCPHCSADFQANIAASPPPVRDGRALNRWLCDQHNLVNERLGKPRFDCGQVLDRWRLGWPDGSCDY